ncbi:MAG: hypothetical protein MJ181_10710 [Treponema sp.]|nr:hypothetical protein [Treponema sp.]
MTNDEVIKDFRKFSKHQENKDKKISELEKENAELSNSVLEFSNSVIELTNTKTELETKITELEKQIEKMKCCGNCEKQLKNVVCVRCKNNSEWEFAE